MAPGCGLWVGGSLLYVKGFLFTMHGLAVRPGPESVEPGKMGHGDGMQFSGTQAASFCKADQTVK